MKVLKFGGSSVANAERINQVINILNEYYIKKDEKFWVVFSAFSGVTDQLINISLQALSRDNKYIENYNLLRDRHIQTLNLLVSRDKNSKILSGVINLLDELGEILNGVFLIKERTPRTLDYIMSFGERLSGYIIAEVMKDRDINCEFLDARKLVVTDETFGSAQVDFDVTNKNIKKYFKENNKINVVTGFIASTKNGETTTLGRGGGDYTASIFGAALKADEIVIWTDVDGIMTADPRKVKEAFSLKAVTYEEAMELSHFGAKVIHPPTIVPALHKKIKIRIKNTFNPEFKGTIIIEREPGIEFNVKGISSIDDISMLTIKGAGMIGVAGIAARVFSVLGRNSISIILISQGSSEHSITLGVLPQYSEKARQLLEEDFKYEIKDGKVDHIKIDNNLSVIAIVGDDMKKTAGVFGKIFYSLGKNGVNVYTVAQGSSELNTSIVVSKDSLKKALNVLHDSLFLSKQKTINLFMIGPGLVGGTLINLMESRLNYLSSELNLKIRLVGLANSRKMIFTSEGIDLSNWKGALESSDEKFTVRKYISKMVDLNLSNTIFIDCTSKDIVVPFYKEILGSSISIVTPNKVANSRPYNEYLEIHRAARENNVQFRYGTNVGAALPIINTLKDLVATGDTILKIEGVLSGTLSYLFNSLKDEDSFSAIVKRAKEMGYTEPDPRDDLNGLDMVRKLLILIRETGTPFEIENVKVENLIPEKARKAKTVEDFLNLLEQFDKDFLDRKNRALKDRKVLCYIAKYEDGIAKVGVEELNEEHPFYNLKGNDNIVAFTTNNYKDKPLMVRGPGAGADVTASGVFSDILRITNYLSV